MNDDQVSMLCTQLLANLEDLFQNQSTDPVCLIERCVLDGALSTFCLAVLPVSTSSAICPKRWPSGEMFILSFVSIPDLSLLSQHLLILVGFIVDTYLGSLRASTRPPNFAKLLLSGERLILPYHATNVPFLEAMVHAA